MNIKINMPYKITLSTIDVWWEATHWCNANVGVIGHTWDVAIVDYIFKEEKDAVMFALRWL